MKWDNKKKEEEKVKCNFDGLENLAVSYFNDGDYFVLIYDYTRVYKNEAVFPTQSPGKMFGILSF